MEAAFEHISAPSSPQATPEQRVISSNSEKLRRLSLKIAKNKYQINPNHIAERLIERSRRS